MPRYKRTRDEFETDAPLEPVVPPRDQETLHKLRNMWEFASLMQYIFLFGHAVKIDDDFDIEDLEAECLKPTPSEKLGNIGLQLLKYVSSHRGLTLEIFDEYTRRQYLAKAPQHNPFGDEEEPTKFNDLDVCTRIKVLQQLSTWTLGNVDRIRSLMPQDADQLSWRMEPLGWDKEDRTYYLLDDNRLYRRADEPLPPPTPKPKAKAKSKAKSKSSKSSRTRATRSSKRRKVEDTEDEEPEEEDEPEEADTAMDDTLMTNGDHAAQEEEPGYGFTSKTWECVAITLEHYQDIMANMFRSRDPNEKNLRARIEADVLPTIEKRAEALRQKQLKKVRELENLQKMATAKRSSRIADKAEKDRQDREEREAEERRHAELKMAREEQERQRRIEEGHESRRLTREQRVREREAKRILHEDELARLESEGERAESQGPSSETADSKRASERQRQTKKEQLEKDLQELADDEGNWYFDCSVCGKHGENMDDGTHSIACDKCNVWQHSKCHGFSPKQAESESFSFVCNTCKRKEEDAKKPKIPPLKLHNRTSGSPEVSKSRPATASGQQSNSRLPDHLARQLDSLPHQQNHPSPGPFGQLTNGPSLLPHGQAQGSPGYRYPPVGNFAPQPTQQTWPHAPPPYATAPSNSHAPASHQQQHLAAHHGAVASAGGHPAYHQPYGYPPQLNGYNPQASAGAHSMAHQSPQHYQYQPQLQPQPPHGHYYPPQQQPQRRSSGQLMNGFQSPSKAGPQASAASPQKYPTQSQGSIPASPPQSHQHQGQPLARSPNTHLPPPTKKEHEASQSPIKSSPPPHLQQQPPHAVSSSPQPPHITQTPHHMKPPGMNGHQSTQQSSHLRTPQMDARPGSANGNNIVADGMSGPWPQGSQAIPQKHDQSPAPPSSAHSIGEKRVFPPHTPLVPSSSQQVSAATGSVPVKKEMPGTDAPPTQTPARSLPQTTTPQ
ncbi:hypothetical protein DOTSEDRAFT_49448 [Lecanosticta acicola]|uniref:PHD-type domain-containing protein n=1 Tax=Lecanosticta acicola TaxID=111012 RepID=A0AAI8Z344_9PEZI|nr:hypothetical protein DOTSEDRAFT_49448 [Lecanosticta acicola]